MDSIQCLGILVMSNKMVIFIGGAIMEITIGKSIFGKQWVYLGYSDSIIVSGKQYVLSGKRHIYAFGVSYMEDNVLHVDPGTLLFDKPIKLFKGLKSLSECRSLEVRYVRVKCEKEWLCIEVKGIQEVKVE